MPEVTLPNYKMESDNMGFPSDFLNPAIKATPEYCYAYVTTADSLDRRGLNANIFKGRQDSYDEYRSYARGNQSIEKYKPILGVKQRSKANPNPVSWKVLNWEILAVYPKFVDLLVSRLIKQNNDIGVKAIDHRAQNERRDKLIELQEYSINKTFLDKIAEQTGIGFETPQADDVVPVPDQPGQMPMYVEMFYKERYCLVLQDLLKLLNNQDNYNSVLADVARDLIEIGLGVIKAYRIGKRIKRRRCVPERMIASATTMDDFSNCRYIGEYWDLTISQLKELAGNQFTEEDYRKIAEQASGNNWNTVNVRDYYDRYYSYPWDNTKVTILDLSWWSADEKVSLHKVDRFGNKQVFEEVQSQSTYDWWQALRARGVSEEAFNKKNYPSQVVIENLNNQYQCMWILQTKFVFNYGLSKDMLKNESDLGTCIGPYTIRSMKKDCMTRIVKPVLDIIQTNYLQYQHHIAKSRPSGAKIEITAIQDVSILGKAGTLMKPKEVLEMYFDTGTILYKRKDISGQPSNWNPIEELKGGISEAAKEHLMQIITWIDVLRNMIGENDLTDASTPSGEMGKAVAKMAAGASREAQGFLHFSFDEINQGAQLRTVMHIAAMASMGMAPDYTEAIGLENMAFLASLSDIGAHEYGVYLERQPTEEIQMVMAGYINSALNAAKPTLYPEEALEIQQESNVYRKIRLLKLYRQQKQVFEAQQQQQMYQGEAQKNIASAQASEQAKQQTQQQLYDMMRAQTWEQAHADAWKSKQTAGDQAFLLSVEYKLKNSLELSLVEQERLTNLAEVRMQGEYMLQGKKIDATKPKAIAK